VTSEIYWHEVKAITFKAKDKDLAASKAMVKDWTHKAKDEARMSNTKVQQHKSVVDITKPYQLPIHSQHWFNQHKKHKAKRINTKGFICKANDLTSEAKAKAKDITSCPRGASRPS